MGGTHENFQVKSSVVLFSHGGYELEGSYVKGCTYDRF